ncbi:MAG: hypothetical protein JO097_16620 [Acidobacteriaceae bacterium]|nr:hypothetical protein [Acidobacteriaceae bacterium]
MKLTNAAQLMNQMFDQMKTMQMAELNKMTVPPEARRSMQETQQKVHGGERNAADPKDRTRCPEGSWAAKQRSKHVRTDPATQRPFAMNLK